MESPSLIVTVRDRIDAEGVKYTSAVWQLLQAKGKFLTPDQAEAYALVQKAHFEFTGYSLPPIKGAKMTKAQVRDSMGPEIKEEVLEKAIQGGLAAKLKQMRGE
jgi:hypothetical protein